MGQYYLIVNLDKEGYIEPHDFGDGAKLMEFGNSEEGTMTGLAILLADGNGRGGGDLRTNKEIVGSWAGDRIVVAGDYADDGKFVNDEDKQEKNLWEVALDEYENVSEKVIEAIVDGEGDWHRQSNGDKEDRWERLREIRDRLFEKKRFVIKHLFNNPENVFVFGKFDSEDIMTLDGEDVDAEARVEGYDWVVEMRPIEHESDELDPTFDEEVYIEALNKYKERIMDDTLFDRAASIFEQD